MTLTSLVERGRGGALLPGPALRLYVLDDETPIELVGEIGIVPANLNAVRVKVKRYLPLQLRNFPGPLLSPGEAASARIRGGSASKPRLPKMAYF